MKFNQRAGRKLMVLAMIFVITACGPGHRGGNMEDEVPFTQLRDHIYEMYQQTLRKLPPGFKLDDARFGAGQSIASCSMEPQERKQRSYADYRDLIGPDKIDAADIVPKVIEIWRGFGWRIDAGVDGETLAWLADGYRIRVLGSEGSVSITAESPCRWQQDENLGVDNAHIITADSIQFD